MINLSLGFILMIVGMTAVFVILLIVIFGSDLMIKLVNRIAPEESFSKAQASEDPLAREIITAAVAQLTGGKGRITSITKI